MAVLPPRAISLHPCGLVTSWVSGKHPSSASHTSRDLICRVGLQTYWGVQSWWDPFPHAPQSGEGAGGSSLCWRWGQGVPAAPVRNMQGGGAGFSTLTAPG